MMKIANFYGFNPNVFFVNPRLTRGGGRP